MRRRLVLGGCLAGLLVASCVSTPDYQPLESQLSAESLGLDGPVYVAPAYGWWRELGDPQLDRLIERALASNPGLSASLARVRGAYEQSRVVGAGRKPQVALETYLYRQHASSNYIYPPPFAGASFWSGSFGANLAWNLDFWGRQAALIEQSEGITRAAGLDSTAASLALSGAIAQTYVDLLRNAELQQVAERTREQRMHLQDLARQRVAAGLDSNVELRSTESAVAQSELELEQLRLARELLVHALAELTGDGTEVYPAITPPVIDLQHALPLPPALPADLLAHRPDVAAAQARIGATVAAKDAAHAAFYPNVDLVGFVGVMGIGIDKVFQGDSQAWNFGPALHLPIFEAGRLRAQYRRSVAEFDAAVANYNQTVLQAVREAADLLSRLESLERQLFEQQRSLNAAGDAYRFAEQRYGAGISSYLTVLNAESQQLNARRQRSNLLADRLQARIALLVALGGSFDPERTGPLAADARMKETSR